MSKPFHTLLLAVLPVLQILSVNRQTVSIGEGAQSVFVAVGLGLTVWIVFSLLQRSMKAGAIPASIFLLFFYLYTPIQLGLLDNSWSGLSRNTVLFPFFALLVLIVFLRARKQKKEGQLYGVTQKLNVFSILVCLLPLLSILSGETEDRSSKANPLLISADSSQEKPNVYWVVLDAYARADVLRERYSFDNRPFIQGLQARGFLVDSLARSNYSQTSLSLASMLNGEYLENLSAEIDSSSVDRRILTKLIRNNHFASALREHGYKSATFSTGYALTEDPGSDKYYGSRHFLGRNPITGALIKRTPLRLLTERFFLPLNGYEWHRDRIKDNFSKLSNMPGLDAPYFAFAHFVSPHKPYIFSKSGDFIPPDAPFSFTASIDYGSSAKGRYVDQLEFINSQILDTIDHIFDRESIPPIIIIQSDHGPDFEASDRMKILQARYFPEDEGVNTFSSVNTSRAVINHIFGSNLPFIADSYFWSSYEKPFEFEDNSSSLSLDK